MIQWQPSDSDPGQTGRVNAHGNERLPPFFATLRRRKAEITEHYQRVRIVHGRRQLYQHWQKLECGRADRSVVSNMIAGDLLRLAVQAGIRVIRIAVASSISATEYSNGLYSPCLQLGAKFE